MRAMRWTLPILVLLAAATAGPARAQVASFDCRQAQTDTEWAICDTPELGKLDVEMATLYDVLEAVSSNASQASPFVSELKRGQSAWVHDTRDPCGGMVDCLAKIYLERVAALQRLARVSLVVRQ